MTQEQRNHVEQRTAELDALMRRIDKARQEQAAHVIGCGKPECAECKRLQAGLNKLYRAYALALDAGPDGVPCQ